jgi:hypothetical protein
MLKMNKVVAKVPLLLIALALDWFGNGVDAFGLLTLNTPSSASGLWSGAELLSRRDVGAQFLATATTAPSLLLSSGGSGDNNDSNKNNELSARLARKDAALLPNKLFNLSPPGPQVYPPWLRGNWQVERTSFAGFLLPSQTIDKARVVANPTVAGFQKLSIANLPDIGRDIPPYRLSIDVATGLEDRAVTWRSLIDAALGYKAVQQVVYNPSKNPNRTSIEFVSYRTTNAERIELFCNAREQSHATTSATNLFCCAEYVRQVTFGTGSTVGVPRQVVTNYANFFTSQRDDEARNDNVVVGNLLTTAYLDPQDPLYFQEPNRPVVVYSHNFRMNQG